MDDESSCVEVLAERRFPSCVSSGALIRWKSDPVTFSLGEFVLVVGGRHALALGLADVVSPGGAGSSSRRSLSTRASDL